MRLFFYQLFRPILLALCRERTCQTLGHLTKLILRPSGSVKGNLHIHAHDITSTNGTLFGGISMLENICEPMSVLAALKVANIMPQCHQATTMTKNELHYDISVNEYNIRVRFLRQLKFYGSVPWYLNGKCIIACELSNYRNHISLPYTFLWTRKITSYYRRISFSEPEVILQIAVEISNHALHEFYYIYANNFLFFWHL